MPKMARLGLFIVAALAILFAGIFIIGSQQGLFTHTYHLRTEFATVSGLLNGAEVRIGGLRKGTIDEIRLPESPLGKVSVTLSLERSTSKLVKTDSLAAIETEGLLGNKYLAISFGSPGAPEVKDWATIASAPPLDVADLFKKTSAIMDTTHSAMKHVDATVTELATMAARVNRGEGTVGALLHERTLYNKFTATADEANATLVQAKLGLTAFQENMQALKKNFLLRGYFKDRGYGDSAELTKWELPQLPGTAPLKKFTFAAQDLFAKADTAQLKNKKPLKEVGRYLEQTPFTLAVVQGFSGLKGDQEANLTLTQAQAMVVRTYLAEGFDVDDGKLKTMGMGEAAAAVPRLDHWIEILVYQE